MISYLNRAWKIQAGLTHLDPYRERTRRRFAVPKSNAFTLKIQVLSLAICPMLWHEKLLFDPAIMTCEISVLHGCKFIDTTYSVIVNDMKQVIELRQPI